MCSPRDVPLGALPFTQLCRGLGPRVPVGRWSWGLISCRTHSWILEQGLSFYSRSLEVNTEQSKESLGSVCGDFIRNQMHLYPVEF